MCGLAGVLSQHIATKEERVFSNLLFVSVMRGAHSTGLIRVATSQEAKVEKRNTMVGQHKFLGPSIDLIRTKEYDTFISRVNKKALLGHCRHATIGGITENNCHPFECGKIIGQHNGTVHDTLEDEKLFETDSEALFHNIDKNGVQETVNQVKRGAYALTWVDMSDSTVHILRNDGRTLFIAEPNTEFGDIYYASEKGFLEMVLGRANITPKQIHSVKPFNEYVFDMSPGSNPTQDFEIIERKRPVTVWSNHYKGSFSSHKTTNSQRTIWNKQTQKWEPVNDKKEEKTIPNLKQIAKSSTSNVQARDHYPGFAKDTYTKDELEGVLVNGCCYCTTVPELKDFEKIIFVDKDYFLCGTCDGHRYSIPATRH